MPEDLSQLTTEQVNESTKHIDEMSTAEALKAINEQDKVVALAVEAALPQLANLIDAAHERLQRGGRLFYVGAGTSGRLGVLDASECPPTYGVDPELVQGVIAGGYKALLKSEEGAEDSAERGVHDLQERGVTSDDVVVGLAASGRTPYVIGALDYARDLGAVTGSVCCAPGAVISEHCEYPVECVTGPECITGSTRMKAGTAQKMILNMISTVLMVKRGKVYGNLMVDVQPTNAKLTARAKRIVATAAGCDEARAERLLELSGRDVKVAICMGISGEADSVCRKTLDEMGGNVSLTIRMLKSSNA